MYIIWNVATVKLSFKNHYTIQMLNSNYFKKIIEDNIQKTGFNKGVTTKENKNEILKENWHYLDTSRMRNAKLKEHELSVTNKQ